MEKSHVAALRKAIEVTGGTQASLAEKLRAEGCVTASQQLVSYWLKNEVLIDPEWWGPLERATGMGRELFRPDIFSMERQQLQAVRHG